MTARATVDTWTRARAGTVMGLEHGERRSEAGERARQPSASEVGAWTVGA
jgi:hypothetical protein